MGTMDLEEASYARNGSISQFQAIITVIRG